MESSGIPAALEVFINPSSTDVAASVIGVSTLVSILSAIASKSSKMGCSTSSSNLDSRSSISEKSTPTAASMPPSMGCNTLSSKALRAFRVVSDRFTPYSFSTASMSSPTPVEAIQSLTASVPAEANASSKESPAIILFVTSFSPSIIAGLKLSAVIPNLAKPDCMKFPPYVDIKNSFGSPVPIALSSNIVSL